MRRQSFLKPPGGVVTPDICEDALVLVGEFGWLAKLWTQAERDEVYNWAMRIHLRASDNPCRVPPRPACLGSGQSPYQPKPHPKVKT